jgi:hypothetical protein
MPDGDGVDAILAGDERLLEVIGKILLGVFFETEAPTEAVEHVRGDLVDRDGAGAFALGFAAHAVGHDEELALRTAVNAGVLVEVEARTVDAHRLVKIGDEEVVLVSRAAATSIGQAVTIHLGKHGELPQRQVSQSRRIIAAAAVVRWRRAAKFSRRDPLRTIMVSVRRTQSRRF